MSDIIPVIAPRPFHKAKARVVVIDIAHHIPGDGTSIISCEGRWSRWIKTDEQVWSRRLMLDENWRQLEVGWVQKCSLMVLKNDTSIPTRDSQADEEDVVEVGISYDPNPAGELRDMHSASLLPTVVIPFTVLRPSESCRLAPPDLGRIQLRSRQGITRCLLTLFPE